MWNLLNQRKGLEKEVYEKLRPGDLFGGTQQVGRQPEHLVRYLLLAAVPVLTFSVIMMLNVQREVAAYGEFHASVWLLAVGVVIALAAWALFQLSRAGEAKALARGGGDSETEPVPPAIRSVMKRAAIMKLLAFRVIIVAAISCCVGFYTGVKGLFLL
jgi:hypothetical protein